MKMLTYAAFGLALLFAAPSAQAWGWFGGQHQHVHTSYCGHEGGGGDGGGPGPSVPEPTGALVFGAGLVATHFASRRRRS